MPLRYTSDIAEHTAVRTAAGLFDLSHMGEIGVTGPDAGRFLDYALVGNLSGLRLLGARYTMICAEDGGVVDDLIVYRDTDDTFLVVANASNHDTVLAAFAERTAGFDVAVEDRSPQTALIAVQGPRALEILRATEGLAEAGHDAETLKYYAAIPMTFQGNPVFVARTGYTGEDGFEFFLDAAARPRPVAGVPRGRRAVRAGARRAVRARQPPPRGRHAAVRQRARPHDHPARRRARPRGEAGQGRRRGQAAPVRRPRRPRGRAPQSEPARVLVGLEGLGRRAARHGYPVKHSTAADAPTVGTVTSGAPSPTLGHPVAMAYVTPEVSAPGTELAVDVRGRYEPVRVVALPFYRRHR